ncbi:MAG: cytidine/deoxycytidylate deaminase family protein [Candidatus Omnitrophica bacterium]|nr:cytidine/deoxycytidylate deaminase family protein [Candidatus Omnitrophota bacterium]
MKKKVERPGWDEYFLKITKVVSSRSTCLRRKVGAVIVKDKRILSSGYNGAPTGLKHCGDLGGCLREKLKIPSGQRHELCRGLHAEQNAIIQAAVHGANIKDSILYCTTHPCTICAKMIINAGIKKIIISASYPDKESKKLLKEAGVKVSAVRKSG